MSVRACHNNQGEKCQLLFVQTQGNHLTSRTLLITHFLQPMCLISGPPGVFVTLMGVTGQTFSPRTLTAGSGPPTRLLSHSGDHSNHSITDQVPMPPTNSTRRFHGWSSTGGLRLPQPDNREETQLHGDTESCMAVLNNYYGDGQSGQIDLPYFTDLRLDSNFKLILSLKR